MNTYKQLVTLISIKYQKVVLCNLKSLLTWETVDQAANNISFNTLTEYLFNHGI